MAGESQRLSPLLDTFICDLNPDIEPSVLPSTLGGEHAQSFVNQFEVCLILSKIVNKLFIQRLTCLQPLLGCFFVIKKDVYVYRFLINWPFLLRIYCLRHWHREGGGALGIWG